MSDNELLRLAAKAYGAKMSDYSDRTPDHWIAERVPGSRSWYAWNPLADDGDALRLAVKLRMLVDVPSAGSVQKLIEVIAPGQLESIFEHCGDDPSAATRRAVVRAAAEIGRAM